MGAYSKLKLKTNSEEKVLTFNDETIKVKQYLPVDTKLEMIGKVISLAADDNHFYNVGKLDILLNVQILHYYTDLSFTATKDDKVTAIYDEVISTGFMDSILTAIPAQELEWIKKVLNETVHAIYEYQNSALGIMNILSTDWKELGIEAPKIQEALNNPENLALVKDILTKLG